MLCCDLDTAVSLLAVLPAETYSISCTKILLNTSSLADLVCKLSNDTWPIVKLLLNSEVPQVAVVFVVLALERGQCVVVLDLYALLDHSALI
jgi:energy-converting hydrogenase Eha subunit E